jgi:hypothetical protein
MCWQTGTSYIPSQGKKRLVIYKKSHFSAILAKILDKKTPQTAKSKAAEYAREKMYTLPPQLALAWAIHRSAFNQETAPETAE